jgi:diguanylate cyclase (GGDEF)-like protein/PAS domain S-box-containing protein
MNVDLTLQETSALYSMIADDKSDIILKTDRGGFVTHASPAIADLSECARDLFGRHIVDLVDPVFAPDVRSEHEAVMRGRSRGRRIEFVSRARVAGARRGQWFEMRMRQLVDPAGRAYGALGLLRSIEDRRSLEERLFAAAMTDALTGFTNRRACLSMVQHLLAERIGGSIALFAVDHFKAINMRFGQCFGDDVLVVCAELLRTLTRRQDILCRLGGENLAVLLPATGLAEAEAVCQPVIEALAQSSREAGTSDFAITASCGIVDISGSLDNTLKRAELALFMAKAKGCNRLEVPPGNEPAQMDDWRRRA